MPGCPLIRLGASFLPPTPDIGSPGPAFSKDPIRSVQPESPTPLAMVLSKVCF